jgi:hypothetical protein
MKFAMDVILLDTTPNSDSVFSTVSNKNADMLNCEVGATPTCAT